MSKYLIAGNWKMNLILDDAIELTNELYEYKDFDSEVEMLICPPYTHLATLLEIVDVSRISIGAQNCHHEEKGAYTGEISIEMLLSIGCEYVILGHSERRLLFDETNEFINKKVIKALENNLRVILCIGESEKERNSGQTNLVLKTQLDECLKNVVKIQDLKIAYEPIWAIGTGNTATTQQIEETHKFISEYLFERYGSNHIKILYGGSMNEKNAQDILSTKYVNGGLIGGASLDANSFLNIYNTAINLI